MKTSVIAASWCAGRRSGVNDDAAVTPEPIAGRDARGRSSMLERETGMQGRGNAAARTKVRRTPPGSGRPMIPEALLDTVGRLLPPALGFRLGARLADGSAWLAGHASRRLLPEQIREYPRRVADLFGEPFTATEARRLMGERLAFLVSRQVVAYILNSDPGRRQVLAHVEVRGAEHLQAALGPGRGAVLTSTHFGFPRLMGPVLDRLGIRYTMARPTGKKEEEVSVRGDLWTRLGALRSFRTALAGGSACVLLADGRMGAPKQMPFFQRETTVTLGAFYLGQLAGCPVLPFFGVMPGRLPRLRMEILPPLSPAKSSSAQALADAAQEFFEVYKVYARQYPSHLPYGRFTAATPGT
jgi:lauroyl/myristoyl acyltransferase